MEVHGKFCPLKEDYFTVFWIIITKANTLFSKITSLNNATFKMFKVEKQLK